MSLILIKGANLGGYISRVPKKGSNNTLKEPFFGKAKKPKVKILTY